jgi:hypothetical protein
MTALGITDTTGGLAVSRSVTVTVTLPVMGLSGKPIVSGAVLPTFNINFDGTMMAAQPTVSANVAGVDRGATVASKLQAPAISAAVTAGEVACPNASVIALAEAGKVHPPLKTEKVTVAPGTGLPIASLTVATSGLGNVVLTIVLCPDPVVATMVAGTPDICAANRQMSEKNRIESAAKLRTIDLIGLLPCVRLADTSRLLYMPGPSIKDFLIGMRMLRISKSAVLKSKT